MRLSQNDFKICHQFICCCWLLRERIDLNNLICYGVSQRHKMSPTGFFFFLISVFKFSSLLFFFSLEESTVIDLHHFTSYIHEQKMVPISRSLKLDFPFSKHDYVRTLFRHPIDKHCCYYCQEYLMQSNMSSSVIFSCSRRQNLPRWIVNLIVVAKCTAFTLKFSCS